MAKEFLNTLMVLFTKEYGSKTKNTDSVRNYGLTGRNIRAYINMAYLMGLESFHGRLVPSILAILKMATLKERASILGLMEEFMMEIEVLGKCMGKEPTPGQTVENTQVNIKMILKKV